MERNIVQIGNSMGVVIPSKLLKRLNLTAKDQVYISLKNGCIVIKPMPRQNWAAFAKQMHKAGDDILEFPDIFEDENMGDIKW